MKNGFKLRPSHFQVAALLWMLVIFYFSHQPGSGPNEVLAWLPGNFKNLLHFPVFGLLGLLFFFAVREYFNNKLFAVTVALLLVLLYGVFDEWHQSYIDGRISSLSDIRNDLLGAILAISGWLGWQKKQRQGIVVNG